MHVRKPLDNIVEGSEWENQPIPLQAPYGDFGSRKTPILTT